MTTTVTDRSGQNNHGYFVGGATSSAKTIGKLGQALTFDGTDDTMPITDAPSLHSGDGSVAMWVKTTGDTDRALYAAEDVGAGADFWTIEIGPSTGTLSNELITVFVGGGSGYAKGYTTTNRNELFDGNWHHIVVTSDASTRIYLDGSERSATLGYGTDSGLFTETAALDDFRVSGYFDPGLNIPFQGILDDVRIYNRALSPVEVQHLYRLGQVIIRQ